MVHAMNSIIFVYSSLRNSILKMKDSVPMSPRFKSNDQNKVSTLNLKVL